MSGLTPVQVAAAAYAGGFRGNDLIDAVKVAYSESDWAPTAHNSCCYGLWQIYLSVHPREMAGRDWKNPIDNAKAAHDIFVAAGSKWCATGVPGAESCNPWQSYGNRKYQAADSQARMAVAQLNQELAAGKSPEEILGESGSAGTPVSPIGFTSDLSSVAKLLGNLLNPNWVKRVGIGVLGIVIVLGAVYFVLPKQAGSFKVVKQIAGNVT